jgi:hypothetical protein
VIIQDDGPEKLDPKYFGELLADLSRKNTDLYHCLLEHLERIGGRYYKYIIHLDVALVKYLGTIL